MSSLRRAIGLPSATALVVGTIIGSAIFVQASEITALVPSPAAVVLAWAAAGVLTLIGALVCAELASAFPRTGGVYVFLKEIYAPSLGFLWGWAMFWTMHSGILAAIATVFARYAGYFVPHGRHRDAAGRDWRHPRAVGRQLPRRAPRRRRPVGVHAGEGRGGGGDHRRGLGAGRSRRAAPPATARGADHAPATSCWRSAPACLRSAAGTW